MSTRGPRAVANIAGTRIGAALLELTGQEIKEELNLTLGLRKDLARHRNAAMNKRPRDAGTIEISAAAAASLPPAHRQSSPPGSAAPSPPSTGAGATQMHVSTRQGGAFNANKIQAMIDAREETIPGDAGGTGTSPKQQEIVDLSSLTADYSGTLASHVTPGAPLCAFAMVCVEWWKAARVLETYTRSGFFAFIWSPLQLLKYFQRLPELEPELRSPALEPSLLPLAFQENGGEDGVRLWGPAWSAGDHSTADKIYRFEKQVIQKICDGEVRSSEEVKTLWLNSLDYRSYTTPCNHRQVLRDSICGITDAAIRRLARLGGVSRFCTMIYEEARGALKFFLEVIQRAALKYCEHSRRNTVTSEDIARALELHALPPPVHSQESLQRPVATAGFFARTEVEDDQMIEEDDLAHPEPQQIMPYLLCFGELIEEIFQDFMVSQPSVISLHVNFCACACSATL